MSSPLTPRVRGACRAFTLIELLTVIAIIGVLTAITFGVVKGVKQRSYISQARTELATLAQALEAYKKQYGDYPQTGQSSTNPNGAADKDDPEGQLFNALAGKLGPRLTALQGRQFVELAKFRLQSADPADLPTPGNDDAVDNALMDPWGRLYLYHYRTTAAGGGGWNRSSYILYSVGPDGNAGVTVSNVGGIVQEDAEQSADNLYANE